MTSVSCSGSSKTTAIPTAVSVWQMAMVARVPKQMAIQPQARLPGATADKDQCQCESRGRDSRPLSDQQEWEAHKKAASHDTVRDAEQHENAKAKPPRSIASAALAEGKLGGGRVRLRRDLRGQNGNQHRRDDANEPKQCVGRPPRQDQQPACCRP